MKYQIFARYKDTKEDFRRSAIHSDEKVEFYLDINEAYRKMNKRAETWYNCDFEIREFE